MNKSHNCSTTFFCVNRITGLTERGSEEWTANAIVLMNPKIPFAFDLGHSTQQNYFCPLLPLSPALGKIKTSMQQQRKTRVAWHHPSEIVTSAQGKFSLFHCQGSLPHTVELSCSQHCYTMEISWTVLLQWLLYFYHPWDLLGFLLKAQTSWKLATDHLCLTHIKEPS